MRSKFVPAVVMALCLAACADEPAPTQAQDVKITDPFKGILDLYEDGKNLDLGDVLHVTSGLATDQLNDALEVSNYGGIQLRETEVFALGADTQNDLTLKNLDGLVTDLAARYGNNELTTEVNQVRQTHLQGTADRYYAEAAFSIGAGLHNWEFAALGVGDGQARLGFDANAELSARVIGAHASESAAYKNSPLSAIKATRGFILPRSIDDIEAMKPGESFALNGQGRLGFNFGVGVPILAGPEAGLTYSIVFSAAARVRLFGELDVQLVRLEGGQVVIDVGMQQGRLDYWKLALEDRFGAQNLIESNVEVGGVSVDLGRLAEKALQKRLLDKISLFDAHVSNETIKSRLSVARFRFDLAYATPDSDVASAIEHVLRGDLRGAQGLANRSEPGVLAEFEMSRSGVSSTSDAGIDIFGMGYHRTVSQDQGAITVQTPGGATTILFDSLHREDGWFFSSHGYSRVALSGMMFDAESGGAARGEANLLMAVEEGDEYMERDKLLDQLDGIILSLAGPEGLAALEASGNELERFVAAHCAGGGAFDQCRTDVLSHPTVIQLREQGLSALAAHAGALEGPPAAVNPVEGQPTEVGPQELLMSAGRLRLAAQATFEPTAQLVGPATSFVYDYRLDNDALDTVMTRYSRDEFERTLIEFYLAEGIKRGDSVEAIAKKRAKIESGAADKVAQMGRVYEELAHQYRLSYAAEDRALPMHPELGAMGIKAIEVRYPVSNGKIRDYENLAARSLSQTRAELAAKLFDEMLKIGQDKGKNAERAVVYTLLALAPTDHVDARLNVDFNFGNTWAQEFDYYETAGYKTLDIYGRAAAASPIDGGLFDLNSLISVK